VIDIQPGQTVAPPNPVPSAPVLGQADRAQAVEPARQVTAARQGSETSSKSRSRPGQGDVPQGSPSQRARPRGGLIDVTI
jgi:hypothetical protein